MKMTDEGLLVRAHTVRDGDAVRVNLAAAATDAATYQWRIVVATEPVILAEGTPGKHLTIVHPDGSEQVLVVTEDCWVHVR